MGIGSTLSEVDQAIHSDFVDVVDEEGLSLRRDYGFFEFAFNPEPEWGMANCSIELHRLTSGRSMTKKWRKSMRVDFPRYLAWDELRDELSRVPGAPALKVTDKGGFLEYRASATNISVIVNEDQGRRRPPARPHPRHLGRLRLVRPRPPPGLTPRVSLP
ncbi:hypothetical protein ACWDZ6_28405 [Streptomyces sp. NPDC002926]